ncbi:hypothetical protein AALT52_01480 [Ligilactobacillus faecis]|uniref:Uncharacterized protein n=1 Tax=Ligilactobacillus faecis TaxID=762833 RepID=A0ABV4DM59_9LACO
MLKNSCIDPKKISKGFIFNEVNCQNNVDTEGCFRITDLFPKVWDAIKNNKLSPKEKYGKLERISISSQLTIANSYSRYDNNYEINPKTLKKEKKLLVRNLKALDEWARSLNLPVYLPIQLRDNRIDNEWDEILDELNDTTQIELISL